MLIEPAGDAWDEDGWHKDRGEYQRNANHGAREFLHGFSSRILRSQTFLNMALHAFHYDNGVVHHQADGQHQPEEGQGIDGKAQ